MDITKHSVPDYLKNKFQLTILEFLPSDVYNLNKPSRALFKIDGEMGWQHIKELTHDDGFIMVVGNITSFCYRSSLANLKFLELAHSEDLKASVILIPKNQNLTASEVKEKFCSYLRNYETLFKSQLHKDLYPLNQMSFANRIMFHLR